MEFKIRCTWQARKSLKKLFMKVVYKFVTLVWLIWHWEENFLGFPGFDKWEKIKYLGLRLNLGLTPPTLSLEVLAKMKAKIVSWGGQ